MSSLHSPSRLSVTFDEGHAVANAGLAQELIDVKPFPGRRVATSVHAVVAGASCIDDADVLRCGATASVLAHKVMAPSTSGTFLRRFTFGHVRQLDRVSEALLTRAWSLGAGPGEEAMTIDLDSTICEVYENQKEGAGYGYTKVLGYHPLLATRRHRRDVARALSKGFGQHPARRPALRARGGGSVSTRRSEWSVDAALRLGLLLQVRGPGV
jgi:hypothetical protein